MPNEDFSDDEFTLIVQDSKSMAEVMRKLNYLVSGGNNASCRKRINRLNLDISHFNQYDRSKMPRRRDVSDYTSNKFWIASNPLKKRLIRENLLEHKCYQCGLSEWQGQPIPIELHHIDGNNKNNSLDNLTVLCPNCHTQTENYCAKNRRTTWEDKKLLRAAKNPTGNCPVCQATVSKDKYCSQACFYQSQRKANRPDKQTLEALIKTNTWRAIAKLYGVTDNTIKNWANKYNIQF